MEENVEIVEDKKPVVKIIIFVILGVLVVAGALVGGYFYGHKKGSAEVKVEEPAPEKDEKEEIEEVPVMSLSKFELKKCLNCENYDVKRVFFSGREYESVTLLIESGRLMAEVNWDVYNKETGSNTKTGTEKYEIKDLSIGNVKMMYAIGNGQYVGSRYYAFLINDGTVKVVDAGSVLEELSNGNDKAFQAYTIDEVRDTYVICGVQLVDKYGATEFNTLAFVQKDGSYYVLKDFSFAKEE